MTTLALKENEQHMPDSLFADCESAFRLIKEGKEKQAEEMFPLEYYLIQKYFYRDFKNLFDLLSERLTLHE